MEKPKILVVDDKRENLFALNKLLQAVQVEVFQALSGVEALDLALEHDFCVAIVDIQMPEMDGYELVELLRSNEVTAALPVIFVSAIFSDEYHHRKGYEAGAVDFLSKPFVPEILLSKVRVFIDLYQQRQALQEANLILTSLNADKDRFFSIISHDLRSPFNALLGNAQFLAGSIDKLDRQDIRDMSQSIYRSAQGVFNLLNSLLVWARLQQDGGMPYCPEAVELRNVAGEALAVLEQAAVQKKINLSNTIEPGCWVQADRSMLETVVRNLVSNALKFTPAGGQVIVSGYQNGAQDSSSVIKVSVQDTGIGMSLADVEKLFKINSSHSTPGTEKEPGSGLGLIICKDMVERNGGQISILSQVGQGTTVEFTVPVAAQA